MADEAPVVHAGVSDRDQGCKRRLGVGKDRTAKTLLGFFRWLGLVRTAALRFVCHDREKPYLKVIAKKAPQANHVLDRFHILAKVNKAIDEVRAQEAKHLERQGETGHEKGPWLSEPAGDRSGVVPSAGSPSRARNDPRNLVRRQNFFLGPLPISILFVEFPYTRRLSIRNGTDADELPG
jgi:hypothetical protein